MRTHESAAVQETMANLRPDSADHDEVLEHAAAQYARALSGAPTEEVQRAAAAFVVDDESRLHLFVVWLLRFLAHRDIDPIIISGAPEPPLRLYADKLGIREVFALTVRTESGLYTEHIERNPGSSTVKRQVTDLISARPGAAVALAMGDSVSDVPILQSAAVSMVVDNPALADRLGALSVSSAADDLEDVVTELL